MCTPLPKVLGTVVSVPARAGDGELVGDAGRHPHALRANQAPSTDIQCRAMAIWGPQHALGGVGVGGRGGAPDATQVALPGKGLNTHSQLHGPHMQTEATAGA